MDIQIAAYDPNNAPPSEVVDVLERGLVRLVRRVEFYESDATTRWNPNGADTEIVRLIDGSVTVDYGSDERRKLDVTLDNADDALHPDPFDGLWYDKVIKVFHGCEYDSADVDQSVAIVESVNIATANECQRILSGFGWNNVTQLLDVTDASKLQDYSVIVSYRPNAPTAKSTMLKTLFEQGKTVITVGVQSTAAQIPVYSSDAASSGAISWGVAQPVNDTPLTGAFVTETLAGTTSGRTPTAVASYAQAIAVYPTGVAPTMITGAIGRSQRGGYWLDLHLPNMTGTESKKLFKAAMKYLKTVVPVKTWETQLGEFYIDQFDSDNFPFQTKITARDATKKLINSKVTRNVSWEAGKSVRDFVIEQLSLGGIPVSKMRLDIGAEVTTSEMSFAAGTSRWDMIKSALDSFGYERFFDGFGNFVARKYLDPTTSPINWTFKTGPDGNLVSIKKSTNDSLVFNHVIVTAAPSDDAANPVGYWGEATVTDENSPTHSNKIGDRVQTIPADWLTSDEDCVDLAIQRLKVSALESYSLAWDSIYYSWLEAGSIVEVLDPDARDYEPTRYLLDGLTYGLGLGPMSATGKRVTFVGSSGGTV